MAFFHECAFSTCDGHSSDGGVRAKLVPLFSRYQAGAEDENPLRCCFCGLVPGSGEYIELELHMEKSAAPQLFGAHTYHLRERMHPQFHVELEPDEP